MDGQTTDNQTSQTGTADKSVSLSGSLGMNAAKSEPEVKPVAGEKTAGEGKTAENRPAWMEQLPADMQTEEMAKRLSKFQKVGDLAKSYSELESKLGSSVVLPGKDAKAEDLEAFYERLGKPKTADAYSIEDKDASPFKELAYKANLTDEQAKSVYGALREAALGQIKTNEEAVKKIEADTVTSLQKEYGAATNEKIKLFARGMKSYGGEAVQKILTDAGVAFSEPVVRMFIKLGEISAEAGSTNKGTTGKNEYVPTSDGGEFSFAAKYNKR